MPPAGLVFVPFVCIYFCAANTILMLEHVTIKAAQEGKFNLEKNTCCINFIRVKSLAYVACYTPQDLYLLFHC